MPLMTIEAVCCLGFGKINRVIAVATYATIGTRSGIKFLLAVSMTHVTAKIHFAMFAAFPFFYNVRGYVGVAFHTTHGKIHFGVLNHFLVFVLPGKEIKS
jgi:hypothetical protein